MDPTSRCWAQVDLDQIEKNYLSARRRLPPGCRVIPVLKGNAYGLGALPVARLLAGLGAQLLAVATVPEALEIKREVNAGVLVMGMASLDAQEAIRRDVILTAYSPESAWTLSQAADRAGRACRVHIKVNTGLNRLGFDCRDLEGIAAAAALPGLKVEGVFTHLGLHGPERDMAQLAAFERAAEGLAHQTGTPLLVHALDSIGLVRYPQQALGGVRLGAWLYGVHPKDVPPQEDPLALALFARVAQVFTAPAGALVGYDDGHPLERPTRIATLACGYGDGYPRLNGQGWVWLGGGRAPVLGPVCMDQMMVDVTGLGWVEPGDAAQLLGGPIGIDEYASWQGLNRNEALCRLTRRTPRLYLRGGKIIHQEGMGL